jgi:hypothetical protein
MTEGCTADNFFRMEWSLLCLGIQLKCSTLSQRGDYVFKGLLQNYDHMWILCLPMPHRVESLEEITSETIFTFQPRSQNQDWCLLFPASTLDGDIIHVPQDIDSDSPYYSYVVQLSDLQDVLSVKNSHMFKTLLC